jgi:hypothetical protein
MMGNVILEGTGNEIQGCLYRENSLIYKISHFQLSYVSFHSWDILVCLVSMQMVNLWYHKLVKYFQR